MKSRSWFLWFLWSPQRSRRGSFCILHLSCSAPHDRNVSPTLWLTKAGWTTRIRRGRSIVGNVSPAATSPTPVHLSHPPPTRFLLLSCPRGGFPPLPISPRKDQRTETDHLSGRLLSRATQPGAGHVQPDAPGLTAQHAQSPAGGGRASLQLANNKPVTISALLKRN